MKQQEVFIKIGAILNELIEHYEYLQNNPDKLSDLELELFVANAHFLANNADILTKLNAQALAKPTEPVNPPQEKYFEPLVHQSKPLTTSTEDRPVPHIDIASDTPGDNYSYIRQEPEVIRHELEIDESWVDDEDDLINEPQEEIIEDIQPLPFEAANEATAIKPVAEKPLPLKPDAEVLTINQKISAQLGSKAGAGPQPIGDLKSAITLNDKLLYVKDLFNGYSLAYSEAIDLLNRFTTFEEADSFLKKNYSVKHKWEDKPQTSEKFYALLKRRYA